MNKKLNKLSKLIVLRNISILEKKRLRFVKILKQIYTGYNNSIINALDKVGFFTFMKNEAVNFRERNSDLLVSNQSEAFKNAATNSVKSLVGPILDIIKKEGNNQREYFNKNFEFMKDIYNSTGYASVISLALQSKLLKRKVKKEYEGADFVDFNDLDAELYELLDQDFDFNFELKDKNLLDVLEQKAQEISYITDLTYETIFTILVSGFYLGTNTPEMVRSDIINYMEDYANTRADYISILETTFSSDKATNDTANKMKAARKSWITMGDEKVRPQHRLNQLGGSRLLHETFAGGPMEYSPSQCESFWNCLVRGNTKIYTSEGWKNVKDIRVGDLVLTHKGRFRKVLRLLSDLPKNNWYRTPQEIITIKFKNPNTQSEDIRGRYSLKTTAEHRYLTPNGWVEARNLKVGDKINVMGILCSECKKNIVLISKRLTSNLCTSCKNKVTAINQWNNPNIRKAMVKAISLKNIEQYKSGVRDKHKQTFKANSKMREMIKSKSWHLQAGNGKLEWHRWEKDRNYRTSIEVKFFKELLHRGFLEEKDFKQQVPILNRYWVDFLFIKQKIVVEVDGDYWHSMKKDKDVLRDAHLVREGYTVLRFSETEINKSVGTCVDTLIRVLNNHEGNYLPIISEITSIKLKKCKECIRIYNFAVEEDESYVADSCIVKNCRCAIALYPDENSPANLLWNGRDFLEI